MHPDYKRTSNNGNFHAILYIIKVLLTLLSKMRPIYCNKFNYQYKVLLLIKIMLKIITKELLIITSFMLRPMAASS
jgi:hypothetical protein